MPIPKRQADPGPQEGDFSTGGGIAPLPAPGALQQAKEQRLWAQGAVTHQKGLNSFGERHVVWIKSSIGRRGH